MHQARCGYDSSNWDQGTRVDATPVAFVVHRDTHLDAPFQFFPEGQRIDELDLEGVSSTTVWSVGGGPGEAIEVDALKRATPRLQRGGLPFPHARGPDFSWPVRGPVITGQGRLAGKTAIVTGGGTDPTGLGNGSAMARELARNGCGVLVTDRDEVAACRTRDAINDAGGRAACVGGDVTSFDDCRTIVERALAEYGRLDILINNVGILVAPGPVYEATEDEWDREMAVNVKSVMLMSKAVIPHLQAGAAIINISSISGTRPMMTGGVYSVTKGAVNALTLALAVQLGERNIRVNCISLGPVWTPMGRRSHLGTGESAEALEQLRTSRRLTTLLKTEGTAMDTANAAVFLASDEARWITGHVLVVDGGATLAPRSYRPAGVPQ